MKSIVSVKASRHKQDLVTTSQHWSGPGGRVSQRLVANLAGKCMGIRAGFLVEEVQGGLGGGPGQLVHPGGDALVQIPQPVVKQATLLLI